MSATTPVEVSDWVQSTTPAPLSATAAPTSAGDGHLAPRVVDPLHVEAVVLADRRPALAERAGDDDRDPSPRPARFATADSIAPVPEALKSSTWLSVRKTAWSRSSVRS